MHVEPSGHKPRWMQDLLRKFQSVHPVKFEVWVIYTIVRLWLIMQV